MLIMGICDACFFLFTTLAFRLGNPAVMGIFSYQSLVYALLADSLIFHMEIGLIQVLATLFIVLVTSSLGLHKYQAEKARTQAKATSERTRLLSFSKSFDMNISRAEVSFSHQTARD